MKASAVMTGVAAQRSRRIALGTVQFGVPYGIFNSAGQVSRDEAAQIVGLAEQSGIDTIDTAIGYGDSEARLGQIGMDAFEIVTKLPAMPRGLDDVARWVRAEIAASLTRLGVSQLHGVLLHRPMELLAQNGGALYAALDRIKADGIARKIGASIYSPEELDALVPNFAFDLVQAPLNLVDRRLASSGWLARLKDRGIEIHTRSALLQGLLMIKCDDTPAYFSRWSDLLDRWHHWLTTTNQSALRAALAYPLSLTQVDRVVVGVESAIQFQQVMESVSSISHERPPDISCDDEALINPAHWPQPRPNHAEEER